MTIIKQYVDKIDDELCSAKEYAEMFLDYKSRTDNTDKTYWSERFHEASLDELKHADYYHELAVKEIERLRKVYTPPQAMLEKWEKSHKEYVERASWIRTMLAM